MIITPMPRGEFNPCNVGRPALWLEADRGIILDGSNNVSTWLDWSGWGRNHAQSDPLKRWHYVENGIGGRPAFDTHDLTNTVMTANVSGLDNLTGWSTVLVIDPYAWGGQQTLFTFENRIIELQHQTNHYNVIIHSGATYFQTLTGVFVTDTPQIITIVFNGSGPTDTEKLTFRINGGQRLLNYGTPNLPTQLGVTTASHFGGGAGGSEPFKGLRGARVDYPKTLSLADCQYLEHGYSEKYGIALAA